MFVLPLHQSQESQVPTAVSYYDDQDYKEVSYTKNQKPLEKALSTSVSASSSKERKPNKGKVSSLSHAKGELSFPSSIKSELWSFYVKFRMKCGFKTSPRIYYVCSVLSAGLMLKD